MQGNARKVLNPPTPAYSQSLGGEAPGTPQGEAVGQALPSTCKGLSEASPAGRPAAASLWPVRSLPLSAAGRPVAASLWPVRSLPPLFLWASEGDVRHFGPPSNPQRAGPLRPLCGLSEACLLSSYGLPKATLGILDRLQTLLGRWQCKACLLSSYGLPKATLGILDRLQTLLGSWQACCGLSVACPKPASSLLMGFRRRREAFWTAFKPSSAAGRPVAASLWPVRSLPPLFLWASEGDVRHFGPPSNPPRQPAGLLRPLCGLSEACLLSSYGLPKATLYLGILDRLQTLLGSWQACCGLSVACPKPASSLLMGFRRRR